MELPVLYSKLSIDGKRIVREAYTARQNGLCYFCKAPLSGEPPAEIKEKKINPKLFPTGFLSHPVHLHHSHDTGLTLGSVHSYCNAVLWQYFGE